MFCVALSVDENLHSVPQLSTVYQPPEYDPELDDMTSLFHDVGEILAQSQAVVFRVDGFGQSPWPVTVWMDLSVFLEQLSDLLNWLDSTNIDAFTLRFYEQGTQRDLFLNRTAGSIYITCQSWKLDWTPEPKVEVMEISVFEFMLEQFIGTFVALVRQQCPGIYDHDWFQQWCHQQGILRRLGPAERQHLLE